MNNYILKVVSEGEFVKFADGKAFVDKDWKPRQFGKRRTREMM